MSITEQLKAPFDPKVIHWRTGATNAKKMAPEPATSGIALAYLDARDVMKRFDEVCGDMWQVEYPFPGCCRIGLYIPPDWTYPNDREWVWRSNGAGKSDIEGEKGIYSDAFKRAAVLWGVGRYLYYLPNVWCDLDNYKNIKTPPKLPAWAMPGSKPKEPTYGLEDKANFDKLIEEGDPMGMYIFEQQNRVTYQSLYHSFAAGEKGKYQKIVDTLWQGGKELIERYKNLYNPEEGIEQFQDELTEAEFEYVKEVS